jgi:hypothetical protein
MLVVASAGFFISKSINFASAGYHKTDLYAEKQFEKRYY